MTSLSLNLPLTAPGGLRRSNGSLVVPPVRCLNADQEAAVTCWDSGEGDAIHRVFAAVGAGNTEALEAALRVGFEPKIHLLHSWSIVSCAAEHSPETLKRVVGLLGYCDIRESSGQSPLMAAIAAKDAERCVLLLRCGAAIEWIDDSGMNCLHWICLDDLGDEIVSELSRNATVRALVTHDLSLHTPITLAAAWNRQGALRHFVRRFFELEGAADLLVGPDRQPLDHYLQADHPGRGPIR